ncbi:LysR family transcriptional regulator [Polycladidibacter hongkongensis]|uniref:LysR family transcriptional regulator n=1 Tax=Polycladidibacter hongkongensis TaxID=1647556 RepID=UPI00083552FE|nr:LysR family transcriptional regulator [Pseudovibrio hongkongensis]
MRLLDLDQLQTFIKINEQGSFTRAAAQLNKTQSAVSMQIRKLEEQLDTTLFERQGRTCRLTIKGEELLPFAEKLIRLNAQAVTTFEKAPVAGTVRLGTPDDYAERFLPEILALFSRSNPKVEVSVVCAPTPDLRTSLEADEIDLAIVTHVRRRSWARHDQVIRREPLVWVGSTRHAVTHEETLHLALGNRHCDWRLAAESTLEEMGRAYKVLYTSWNSTAVSAAVLSGLAVSVLPESALRPGMRVLTPEEGFPQLPLCEIGLVRGPNGGQATAKALADHIVSSLYNISQ